MCTFALRHPWALRCTAMYLFVPYLTGSMCWVLSNAISLLCKWLTSLCQDSSPVMQGGLCILLHHWLQLAYFPSALSTPTVQLSRLYIICCLLHLSKLGHISTYVPHQTVQAGHSFCTIWANPAFSNAKAGGCNVRGCSRKAVGHRLTVHTCQTCTNQCSATELFCKLHSRL